jgi:cation diffusion facilitator family transporter
MNLLPGHMPKAESRAMLLSLIVGVLLMTLKFAAFLITGSAAIFSDALESIANVLGAGVAFYSLSLAHRPPDSDHPYGHGKAEFMSAAFEGGMILIAGVAIIIKTLGALIRGQVELQELGLGLVMIATAMVLNGAVGLYLIHIGRKQHSLTLEADGKHLMSDAITSVAALVALGIVQLTGWKYADPIAALLMAGYIGVMGVRLLAQSAGGLMDVQDKSDQQRLEGILQAHVGPAGNEPRICSYHKLRHRHSGRYHWVDFHIMLPGILSVCEGHDLASKIEYEMEQSLGEGNATAHIEPCPNAECELCAKVKREA